MRRLRLLLWGAVAICAGGERNAVAGPYVRVPSGPTDALAAGQAAVLYLNDCKPSGCTLKPGTTDSRVNTSAIIGAPRTLPAFSGTQTTWDALVGCMREMYAPFGIDIVTENPGMTPHYESMIAGVSTDLGFPGGILGISPFSCGVIPNAITFTFANTTPDDVLALCWTAAQESAHAFGLEHSMTANDAMTYNPTPAQKSFVDVDGCIGTQGCCQPSQECQCGRTSINSYRRLLAVLGTRLPTPPTVTITSPQDGESVLAGFAVEAEIDDIDGVALVELAIDGAVVATRTDPPFLFTTDSALAAGDHTISVRSEDMLGASGSAEIGVVRMPEPEPEPEPDPEDAGCGCTTVSGGGPSSFVLAIAFIALLRRRRFPH